MSGPAPRLLFFSHDRRGLGHIRRTLALASAWLDRVPLSEILIVTGCPEAHRLAPSTGIDYVKLPRLSRNADGTLSAFGTNLPVTAVQKLREKLLLTTTRTFRPDIMLVDSPPLAASAEHASSIRWLRRYLPHCATVLNLRDILDAPGEVLREWRLHGVARKIADDFDLVLVHGSKQVFDLPSQYQFDEHLLKKTVFCGYVKHQTYADAADKLRARLCKGQQKLIVVTVGGGADGGGLLEQCVEAVSLDSELRAHHTLIIHGPELDASRGAALASRCSNNPNITLVPFLSPETGHIAAADVIVSMAGYNTISEIVSQRKRAIVIPRTARSNEQIIRAERFAALGLIQMIRPEAMSATRVASAVRTAIDHGPPRGLDAEFGDGTGFVRYIQSTSLNIAAARALQ